MKTSPHLTFSPGFKRLLLIIVVISALIGCKRIIESFSAPEIYKKDFIQEYLMGKAVTAGVNPYLPLPELAGYWMGYANYKRLKHPTPHPPFVSLLGAPFGLFSYERAAVIWLVFELVCLLAAVLLSLRWWGAPARTTTVLMIYVIALGWVPVIEDLWFGQLTICLLALLLGVWLAFREKRDTLGGALLGVSIALKLIGLPLLIFLIFQRKWKGLISALATAIIANLITMLVIGVGPVIDYYLNIGPLVASIYRRHDGNYSVWTLGDRFFSGFGNNFWVPALWPSPHLAQLLTYIIPSVILLLGVRLALKARELDTAFGLLVGIGILVSPIAWTHYLMLSLIPIMVTARRLCLSGLPRQISYVTFCLWIMLSIAGAGYSSFVRLTAYGTTAEGIPIVSFMAGLLTLVPAIALISILWIVWKSDNTIFNAPSCLAQAKYSENYL